MAAYLDRRGRAARPRARTHVNRARRGRERSASGAPTLTCPYLTETRAGPTVEGMPVDETHIEGDWSSIAQPAGDRGRLAQGPLTLAKGRRPPLRWCCLSAVALAVGCGSTTTRAAHPLSASTTVRPWSQPVAPAVPETHRVHPGSLGRSSDCVATTAAQPPGRETPDGLVGADDRPSGAELSWLPGREDQRCEVLFTRANEKHAQQLVDDVNTTPVIPTDRPYNCLTTNDAEILLVFRYRTGFESLQVMLTGCAAVSAPNQYSRFVTQRLRDDLRGLAPSGVRI